MRLPVRIVFEQRGEAPKRLSALVPLVSVLAALFFGAALFARFFARFFGDSSLFFRERAPKPRRALLRVFRFFIPDLPFPSFPPNAM